MKKTTKSVFEPQLGQVIIDLNERFNCAADRYSERRARQVVVVGWGLAHPAISVIIHVRWLKCACVCIVHVTYNTVHCC